MFSGIVEGLGEVRKVEGLSPGKRFHVGISEFSRGLKPGSSVCISGCCLTVSGISKGIAEFDVMPETLRKTYFGGLKEKDRVNVERSLRLGDEVGGHFVSGHVDCVGTITGRKDFSDFSEMEVEFPEEFSHLLIDKGSVAVDGISLTVVKAGKGRFSIALIPTTLKLTTLGFKREGSKVNLEFDQVAKYVAKLLGK
jgi:riboflavin synthase